MWYNMSIKDDTEARKMTEARGKHGMERGVEALQRLKDAGYEAYSAADQGCFF